MRTQGPAPPRSKPYSLISSKKCCVFSVDGADEHDVAGLAVEGDQARALLLPAVAQLAQHVGGVVIAGRRLHAQGVEFLGFREGMRATSEKRGMMPPP